MVDPLSYNPDDAFYGPLGDYAKQSAAHIELDHFTLYCQTLVIFSAILGRRRACWGGDSINYPNLFGLVIADSAQGKGCTCNRAERLAEAVDQKFKSFVHRDVQSAPALIRLVTDEQRKVVPGNRKNGGIPTEIIHLPAVTDKRCLLLQSEMQSTFTAKGRSGCTLGQLLNQAWDGETLENNTKDECRRATNPHVSVLGSITPQDFRQAIVTSKTDLTNGFFNRFLFIRPQPVRLLPHGGDRTVPRDIVDTLRDAISVLGPSVPPPESPPLLEFDAEAAQAWEPFYYACRLGEHAFFEGLTGLCARGAPITKRIAMILATLDGSLEIRAAHLKAAQATWLRSQDQARSLLDFGGSSSAASDALSKTLEKLRARVRPNEAWRTKSDVWALLGRHGSKDHVSAAIDTLVSSGEWARQAGGDGTERYRATDCPVGPDGAQDCDNAPILPADHNDAPPLALGRQGASHNDNSDCDVITIAGHAIGLGQAFQIPRNIDSLTIDDRSHCISGGTVARPVQNLSRIKEDRLWLDSLAAQKPHHRLVYIDGDLFFMPLKPYAKWALTPLGHVA